MNGVRLLKRNYYDMNYNKNIIIIIIEIIIIIIIKIQIIFYFTNNIPMYQNLCLIVFSNGKILIQFVVFAESNLKVNYYYDN